MFHVQPITDFSRPELGPYRTMRRQMEHREQGIFVAEGEKVVRRLLSSRFTVVSLLVPEKWAVELEPALRARPENIEVYVADKKLLETLTGFSMYQGLLAVGRVPEVKSVESVISRSRSPRLFVAVDGLSNAENLGAIVRNAAAFGADGLIASGTSCSPFLRRAVRSSMGTVFELPIIEVPDLPAALNTLRKNAVRCIAAHAHIEGRTLTQANFAQDSCIVLGSEGYGASPEVLAACDDAVAIPMPPNVDSLNVASAAAVFLYEACRQRGKL